MSSTNNTNQGARKSMKGQAVPNFTEGDARPSSKRCVGAMSRSAAIAGTPTFTVWAGTTRPGVFKCRGCREQFTVTVNTVMEDTHLPLATWAKAFHLICSSKKGMSALQLQRNLGLGSYRTAWFLAHRIREGMKCEPVAGTLKGQVQVDEAYIGGKYRVGSGEDRKSQYPLAAANFEGGHQMVNHSKQGYARKSINENRELETITTNTAESFFSLPKRGVYGTFHHVSKQHLHRYCVEFDFRWNGRNWKIRSAGMRRSRRRKGSGCSARSR